MLELSPFSLRLLKASFHASEDGYSGIQQLAHDANLLFYGSDEAKEGREAYKAKRTPGLRQVPQAPLMSPLKLWIVAARPRTLPAAVAPVLVGTALAIAADEFGAVAFVAALVGSVFLQIGTNLANDYSDARRGADTEDRLGPVRVTAGGLMPPRRVLAGTYIAFGVAMRRRRGAHRDRRAGDAGRGRRLDRRGRALHRRPRGPTATRASASCSCSCSSAWWPWCSPSTPRPRTYPWEAFALSVPVGLLAAAILVVNNVRDVDTDRRAGKRTLAVKLGRERARRLFDAMLVTSYLIAWSSPPPAG